MLNKITKVLLLFFVCLNLILNEANATVRYVKPSSSGLGDGTSWANAGTLADQLMQASGGDEIWVVAGEYLPTLSWSGSSNPTDSRTKTFFIKEGVSLYGGFAGTEVAIGQRNFRTNSCILNGDIGVSGSSLDNCYHVLTAVNLGFGGIRLDGFTIKNGKAPATSVFETINTVSVYAGYGAGIFIQGGENTIVNSTFINNASGDLGGAIYAYNSGSTIGNNFFIENSAILGGAMGLMIGTANIYNGVFVENSASIGGGGIHAQDLLGSISNCTFYANDANADGGALYLANNTGVTVANNLFNLNNLNGNTNAGTAEIFAGGTTNTIRYNLLYLPLSAYPGYDPSNLFAQRPYFVNASSVSGIDGIYGNSDDGLRVYTCSPSYNAGDNSLIYSLNTTDVTDDSRSIASIVDLGAYENAIAAMTTTQITSQPSLVTACPGTNQLFGIIAQGDYLTYQWQKDGSDLLGEIDDTLRLFNVTPAVNQGSYRVIVKGACGSEISNAEGLSFYQQTSIASQPQPFYTCAGGSKDISVEATGSSLLYQWFKNNTPIPGETNDLLSFPSISNADQGQYFVKIISTCDVVFSDTIEFSLKNNSRKYVNASATGSMNGLSWTNAYPNIDMAISESCEATEIWVAAGTYIPASDFNGNSSPIDERTKTFFIKPGMKLYGGFLGTETNLSQRNININPSILSGNIGIASDSTDNAYHTLLIMKSVNDTTIIDGFHIQDGLSNNSTGTTIGQQYISNDAGSGVYAVDSRVSIRNCQIQNNAASYGAGLYITFDYEDGTLFPFDLNRNTISNNRTVQWGGPAIFLEYAKGTIRNNKIHNNTDMDGDGIVTISSSEVSVLNNIFADNISSSLGCLVNYPTGVPLLVVNNTFANNHIIDAGSVGAAFWSPNEDTLVNNIFWGNTIDGDAYVDLADVSIAQSAVIHHNLFQTIETAYGFTNASNNYFKTSPKFRDSTNVAGLDNIFGTIDDGLILQSSSPAINSGDNASVPAFLINDIVGGNRIYSSVVDMGVFEAGPWLSTKDQTDANLHILAYPNPADAMILVQIPNGELDKLIAKNMIGQEFILPYFQVDRNTHQVDLSTLPGGVYLLDVLSNGSHGTLTVVIK